MTPQLKRIEQLEETADSLHQAYVNARSQIPQWHDEPPPVGTWCVGISAGNTYYGRFANGRFVDQDGTHFGDFGHIRRWLFPLPPPPTQERSE